MSLSQERSSGVYVPHPDDTSFSVFKTEGYSGEIFDTLPPGLRDTVVAATQAARHDGVLTFHFKEIEYANGEKATWKFGNYTDVFQMAATHNPDDLEELRYVESYHIRPNLTPHIGYVRGTNVPFFGMNVARALGFNKEHAHVIRREDDFSAQDSNGRKLDDATRLELQQLTAEFYVSPPSTYIYGMNV